MVGLELDAIKSGGVWLCLSDLLRTEEWLDGSFEVVSFQCLKSDSRVKVLQYFVLILIIRWNRRYSAFTLLSRYIPGQRFDRRSEADALAAKENTVKASRLIDSGIAVISDLSMDRLISG